MKITALTLALAKPRWALLRLETDAGLTGFGEPSLLPGVDAVMEAVRALEPLLIGKDPEQMGPLCTEMHQHALTTGGAAAFSAMSGVEHALWDLKGKVANQPVYELLGGACRDKVRVVTHCIGRSPRDLASAAKVRRIKGMLAVKVNLGVLPRRTSRLKFASSIRERVVAIRDEVGSEIDVILDFQGRISSNTAINVIDALKDLDLLYIEEPCPGSNVPALMRVAARSSFGIASGRSSTSAKVGPSTSSIARNGTSRST